MELVLLGGKRVRELIVENVYWGYIFVRKKLSLY